MTHEPVRLGAVSWFQDDGFRLRSAEASDADALFGYLNHEDVYDDRQFDLDRPWPLGRAEIERQLGESTDAGRTFVIETGGAIVGHVAVEWWWDALQPWAGVVIAPQHRRNGYGRRAADMVLGFLFDRTAAHVVTAQTGDWNERGMRFAETMGFSRAGRYRNSTRMGGTWRDTITYDLLRREWEERHAADR